jgi:acyl dehydratase
VHVRLKSKRVTSKPDRGVVVTAHEVVNGKGETVMTYDSTRMIRTRSYVETATN